MKLINISGENREITNGGKIYEFPSSGKEYTEVPEELGEKLISTGQFKEFLKNKISKKAIKEEEDEDKENKEVENYDSTI